jgi:phage recombination protein Bet
VPIRGYIIPAWDSYILRAFHVSAFAGWIVFIPKEEIMQNNNTTTVATTSSSAAKTLATTLGVNAEELQRVIVNTIMPQGSTNEEVAAFMMIANTYKLNPLLKHIAAFKTSKNGIMPMVMIDGWVMIMNTHPRFNGMEQFENFDENKDSWSVKTSIFVKGIEHPISVAEYHEECFMDTEPWKKYPKRMLRHKSLIQCIRYALGIGGIYDQDEILRLDAIDADVVPINSYIDGPQRSIPKYSAIEAAVSAMGGVKLELRKEYGKDFAYVIGNTFENKAELAKLGFVTKKNSEGKWDTRMDVSLNLQQEDAKETHPKDEKTLASSASEASLPEIETLQDLQKYVEDNGFGFASNSNVDGDRIFAKMDIDPEDEAQVAFAISLGFKKTGKGMVRDVTDIAKLIA